MEIQKTTMEIEEKGVKLRLTIVDTPGIIFQSLKVHIFWEDHKILRNLHHRFVPCIASQIYSGDFAKFCGILRIHELHNTYFNWHNQFMVKLAKVIQIKILCPKTSANDEKDVKNLTKSLTLEQFIIK